MIVTLGALVMLAATAAPAGAPAVPLRLSLRAIGGTSVELVLQNVSDKAVLVPKAIAFHLDKGMYWAPAYVAVGRTAGGVQVQPATSRSPDARSSPVRLEPGALRRMQVQLADLKWDRTIDGGPWPTQDLASVVPPGEHPLTVQLEFEGANGVIRSNAVAVVIPKK